MLYGFNVVGWIQWEGIKQFIALAVTTEHAATNDTGIYQQEEWFHLKINIELSPN